MEMVKLNLGAGDTPMEGYVNLDRKTGQEVYPLGYENGSVDEIRASHILEHFGRGDTHNVLKNWVEKLKPGGVMKVAVPDFAKIVEGYKADDPKVAGYLCGGQVDENDYHKNIFDHNSLSHAMEDAGLINIRNWDSDACDCSSLPISLNLQGEKGESTADPQIERVQKRVTAIMSAPRVGFTNNLMLAAKVLVPLNIELDIGYGVFWGQILTRMMEEQIEKGTEWIIVLDYDSIYTKEQLVALLQMMVRYPEADAIMPVQHKRESNSVLAGVNDVKMANREYNVNTDLIEVDTGHFGCTVFRCEAFKKLKKPWFLPIPDQDGGWGEGRTDEDIYFWKNWRASGNNLYLTPKVMIGHMQLMVTWPNGSLDKGAKPYHQYLSAIEKEGIPEWCKVANEDIPKVVQDES